MKPPYCIPSMGEIMQAKKHGARVISTFSGAGGSSLGYHMAGFDVLWANEFIPAARETYAANFPKTIIDPRDIREIKPEEILSATGIQRGELELFDGSPPCAAFSTAGKREKHWGKVKEYSDSAQRVDDLFFEYARLLEGLQPKTFIAENVSGLVKGTAKGYFKLILERLTACGYQVRAFLVNSLYTGVPQKRERLIFIGVRNDLNQAPPEPRPLPYSYTLGEAIPEREINGLAWLLPETSQTSRLWHHAKAHNFSPLEQAAEVLLGRSTMMQHYRCVWDKPVNTVVQGSVCLYHPDRPRSLSIPELKRASSFPDDFSLTGSFKQQWERIGRAVPPRMMQHIANTIYQGVLG
jgi:DNA (cytosine-5)-methyltransferase 1